MKETSKEIAVKEGQIVSPVTSEKPVQAVALPPKQQQAVALLIAGATTEQVANELGVHRSTVWAWKQQEPFQAYLNMMVREAQTTVREGVLKLSEDAIHGLWNIIPSRAHHIKPVPTS